MNDNYMVYYVKNNIVYFRDSRYGVSGSEPLNGRNVKDVAEKVAKTYNVTTLERI